MHSEGSCGVGNLVPIARLPPHHAFGDRPFVVSRPGTRHAKGMDALAVAAGGTLCVWSAGTRARGWHAVGDVGGRAREEGA